MSSSFLSLESFPFSCFLYLSAFIIFIKPLNLAKQFTLYLLYLRVCNYILKNVSPVIVTSQLIWYTRVICEKHTIIKKTFSIWKTDLICIIFLIVLSLFYNIIYYDISYNIVFTIFNTISVITSFLQYFLKYLL